MSQCYRRHVHEHAFTALNAEQAALARALGKTPEEFAATAQKGA